MLPNAVTSARSGQIRARREVRTLLISSRVDGDTSSCIDREVDGVGRHQVGVDRAPLPGVEGGDDPQLRRGQIEVEYVEILGDPTGIH